MENSTKTEILSSLGWFFSVQRYCYRSRNRNRGLMQQLTCGVCT